MARLIDADELKKEITSAFHGVLGVTIRIAMHGFIDKQPTIDPESLRPHGKWIQMSEKSYRKKCSCCGWDGPEWVKFYSFCPNCGAKLEELKDADA